MLLEIEHRLAFEYDAYISESFLELRVQPKTTPHQTLHSFVLAVGPPSKRLPLPRLERQRRPSLHDHAASTTASRS